MKLREMLEDNFLNKPDQIAWRRPTSDEEYHIVNFPEYTTMFVPGEVVYLMDYEVKEWAFDIRNCRLYVDLCKEEESSSAVEDEQEDPEEEDDEDDDDEGDWDIKVKLSEEAGSTTWTQTYMNVSFNRALGYYNTMIDKLNNGCAFVRFPGNGDGENDVAMASSQIMYIVIERSKG